MGSNRSGTGTGGTTKKCSFSLNKAVIDDLTFISDSIGVSRSAFLSMLLAESLPQLRIAAEQVTLPEPEPVVEVAKRYCENSKRILDERMAYLRGTDDGKLPS
jgi:hypothetical protein